MSEFSKPAVLLLGGIPVLKCDEKSMRVASNDQPVYTQESGLDGFSDGAAEVDISLKQAIPQSGFVIDWNYLAINHVTVRPTFQIAGKSYELEGRVMTADSGGAVNRANKVDVALKCRVVGIARLSA